MSAWTRDGLQLTVDGPALFRRALVALLIGAVLTSSTWMVQRVGSTQMVTGEAFCQDPAPCTVPALGAGFPVAWMVDNPEISVAGSLHPIEDEFRPLAFALDTGFFALLAAGVLLLIRRQARRPVE